MNVPVLLITFNRPEHTKQAVRALRAQQPPVVYVFQDGPREGNEEDNDKCLRVKEVVKTEIDWPCELYTSFSETNRGCRDAVIYAITEVLKRHEEVIVVEDDIITSPAFYAYMCKALEYYKDRKTVFSISGHSPSPKHFLVPEDYDYDVFASPRLFNWGWGTWRDRWEQADWSMSYYGEFMAHPYEQKAFCRAGDDMIDMLVNEKQGRSSAWDIQFAFTHFRNHAVSIVPCISYTYNIGQDGSGTHSHLISNDVSLSVLNENPNPKLIDNLYFDSRIINSLCSIYSKKKRPIWQKAINYFMRKLGLKPPFFVKKKVFTDD